MDSNNPVVKECVKGLRAETEGRDGDAYKLYMQAYEAAADDYEACIAAHYIARHQESREEMLRWNREALDRALAVNDHRADAFYPSLYLNMGRTYESLGQQTEAEQYYNLANLWIDALPAGAYATMIEKGISEGKGRTAQPKA